MTPAQLREHIAMETEGALTPAQRDTPLSAQSIALVERLCAADLVLAMRRVRDTAPHWDEMTRERFAQQFESQALQFTAAAAYLRRHRADTGVPEWLRNAT